jgi:hypothetical protein
MCARVHECIYACTGNDLDVLTLWPVGLAWASAQGIFVHAFCCKATKGRSAQECTNSNPSRVPTAGPRTNRGAPSAASATHGVRAGTSYTRGRARLDGREIAVPRGVVQLAALDQPCSGVPRLCRIVPGRRGRRPTNHDGRTAVALVQPPLAAPAAATSAIVISRTRAHRAREPMWAAMQTSAEETLLRLGIGTGSWRFRDTMELGWPPSIGDQELPRRAASRTGRGGPAGLFPAQPAHAGDANRAPALGEPGRNHDGAPAIRPWAGRPLPACRQLRWPNSPAPGVQTPVGRISIKLTPMPAQGPAARSCGGPIHGALCLPWYSQCR